MSLRQHLLGENELIGSDAAGEWDIYQGERAGFKSANPPPMPSAAFYWWPFMP
jgi:hypothetical protein